MASTCSAYGRPTGLQQCVSRDNATLRLLLSTRKPSNYVSRLMGVVTFHIIHDCSSKICKMLYITFSIVWIANMSFSF